mgnify:CR=1 FL=1
MATENRAILKKVDIMDRSGAMDGGQDKAVLGIHRRMLLDPKMQFGRIFGNFLRLWLR